jgi:DNA (cytosine-5)-methyltransferase 1
LSRKPKALDLFCGCGGLSVGLKRAGFRILAGIDSDSLAVKTYAKNHRRAVAIEGDIRKISGSSILKRLKLERGGLDLLAGCPPCQGFSTLRTLNGQRRVREPMNDLIFEFLRFVRVLRPKTIMMENVPGLARNVRLRRFCQALDQMGYEWTYDVLNAVDYGVPQHRRRMILVASRIGSVAFARKSRVRKTVREAIGHLPNQGKSGDPLHDHAARRSPAVLAIIRRIPRDGGSRSALPQSKQLACHRDIEGFNDIYGRMAWDKPAPTITGGCVNPSKGRFLHPKHHRAITLREAALLQGFPRQYHFSLDRGIYPAAQMIGNAFPPNFATRHARQLLKQLQS